VGQAALAPFRAVAQPLIDMAMPMPYPAIYQFTAAGEQRGFALHASRFVTELDDDAIDAMLAATAAPSSPMAMIQLRVLGGAMARVAADATAFALRSAPIMATVIVPFEDPTTEPAQRAWTDRVFEALAPKDAGVYANFLEDEGDERIHAAYPAGTYERLADVKRRYDPANVFRMNQNIRPPAIG